MVRGPRYLRIQEMNPTPLAIKKPPTTRTSIGRFKVGGRPIKFEIKEAIKKIAETIARIISIAATDVVIFFMLKV